MLRDKSLTELRGIAQSFGVEEIFKKDIAHLLQAIEAKQVALAPKPHISIPTPAYDARLMTRIPAKQSSMEDIKELLKPYTSLGMKLYFDEERWYMSCGSKRDEGTLRMPLRIVLKCADKVMA